MTFCLLRGIGRAMGNIFRGGNCGGGYSYGNRAGGGWRMPANYGGYGAGNYSGYGGGYGSLCNNGLGSAGYGSYANSGYYGAPPQAYGNNDYGCPTPQMLYGGGKPPMPWANCAATLPIAKPVTSGCANSGFLQGPPLGAAPGVPVAFGAPTSPQPGCFRMPTAITPTGQLAQGPLGNANQPEIIQDRNKPWYYKANAGTNRMGNAPGDFMRSFNPTDGQQLSGMFRQNMGDGRMRYGQYTQTANAYQGHYMEDNQRFHFAMQKNDSGDWGPMRVTDPNGQPVTSFPMDTLAQADQLHANAANPGDQLGDSLGAQTPRGVGMNPGPAAQQPGQPQGPLTPPGPVNFA